MASPWSSPCYATAPSTPKQLSSDDSFFFSAASDRVEFGESFSSVPFDWELKPGHPKSSSSPNHSSNNNKNINDTTFTYDDEKNLSSSSISYIGKITEPAASTDHLKPPPPMPLGASSRDLFSRRGVSKRSVLLGLRMPTRSCDFDFDPFEAAIEISARRGDAYSVDDIGEEQHKHTANNTTTSFRKREENTNSNGKKWRLRKLLPFLKTTSSLSPLSSSVSSKGSTTSSTGSTGSVSGSRRVVSRAYGYNGCVLGCFGLGNNAVAMHDFVRDLVPLSPHSHSHDSPY